MRAEHARHAGNHIRPAGAGVNHGDALLQQITHQRFGRIESVQHTDVGLVGIALLVLMLISGLAFSELMKTRDGFWFKVGTLLPAVGVLGAGYSAPFWLGPLVASFALTLLPIAYIGFFTLCNSRKFMSDDMATGGARWGWNVAMLVVVALSIVGASAKVVDLET